MDEITAGGMVLQGHTVPVFGAKLLVLQAANGMLGCGYLNVATADKLGHALAIVTGVSGYADMLSAEVRQVSAAAALGRQVLDGGHHMVRRGWRRRRRGGPIRSRP